MCHHQNAGHDVIKETNYKSFENMLNIIYLGTAVSKQNYIYETR
jgi:hypothetical protein